MISNLVAYILNSRLRFCSLLGRLPVVLIVAILGIPDFMTSMIADNHAIHTKDGVARLQMETTLAVLGDGGRSAY